MRIRLCQLPASALSRAERGLAGILYVEGAPNPDIFNPLPSQPDTR